MESTYLQILLPVLDDGLISTDHHVAMPQSVIELVTRRVLVMASLEDPLSRMLEKMESKAINQVPLEQTYMKRSLSSLSQRSLVEPSYRRHRIVPPCEFQGLCLQKLPWSKLLQ
jgi:hypothetical protein